MFGTVTVAIRYQWLDQFGTTLYTSRDVGITFLNALPACVRLTTRFLEGAYDGSRVIRRLPRTAILTVTVRWTLVLGKI